MNEGEPMDHARERLLEQERTARREAETVARARDQFLALVSHELRTPLNAISSWAQVLENQLVRRNDRHDVADDPVVVRALRGIQRGVHQQSRLVDDLLDTTLAMSGRLKLDYRRERFRSLMDEAVDSQRAVASERDVTLQVVLDLEGAEMVADRRRLVRAIEHLLDNAIKFSASGAVVRIEAHSAYGRAMVRIEDSGQGVPSQVRQALFAPFFQLDDSSSRRTGGLGIGLTLARLLVESHGGRIALDSPGPGLGTIVALDLPLAQAPTLVDAAPVHEDDRARRRLADLEILVIDDQVEARESLRLLLQQSGARVVVSTSTQAGLSAVESAAHPPDAVICDIAMPDEDGYVFLRRFRQLEQRRMQDHDGPAHGHIPVIALSAFVHSDQSDAMPWEDFDDRLTKPVAADVLLDRIVRATSRH